MAEPTEFIDIDQSGNVIEVRADTACTLAHPKGEIDQLTDDGDGVPRSYGDVWINPPITLRDCKVGDVVFAKIVGNQPHIWLICKVASAVRSGHARKGEGDAR